MEIQVIFGSGEPLPRSLLEIYSRKVRDCDHPALLKVLDVCTQADGTWALLLPRPEGSPLTLSTLARQVNGWKIPFAIARTLAEVLARLHAAGVRGGLPFSWGTWVHAVRQGEHVLLALLPPTPRHFAEAAAPTGHRGGTPVSPAEDVFAIGVVLCELLSGAPCSAGMPSPLALQQRHPDLPARLVEQVSAALAPAPGERPSLDDLALMLAMFSRELISAPNASAGSPPAAGAQPPSTFLSLFTGRVVELHLGKKLPSAVGDAVSLACFPVAPGSLSKSSPTPGTTVHVQARPVMPKSTAIMPLRSAESPGQAAPAEAAGISALRPSSIPGASPVDCSVMAPPTMAPGSMFLVQVFLHTPDAAETARALALEFDPAARRLGMNALEVDLPPGAVVMAALTLPGVEVEDPVQRITWRGRTTSIQFGASLPPGIPPGALLGRVTLHLEGVPVGSIRFKMEVVQKEAALAPQRLEAEPVRFQQAFISYSSKDRTEVLKRVQMLERFHIHFFQDVLNLEPGARWEQELYRHIDDCDVLLLFWSTAARDSQWVDKEVRYALERQAGSPAQVPQIIPVLIEGPPVPMPPEHLAHLHFNDRLLYFRDAPNPVG